MDNKLLTALKKEKKRQNQNIELIASENYVSKDVLKLQGSILTNKYAEGYSGKRYYGGCENIDIFETTAIEYLKELNKKLKEEVVEYLEDNNVEELADIVEVIYGILDVKNVSLDEFEKIRKDKVDKRGAFSKKIFLEKVIEKINL